MEPDEPVTLSQLISQCNTLSPAAGSSLTRVGDAAARGCIGCTGDAAVRRAGGGRQRARTGACYEKAVLTGTDLQLLLEEPLPPERSAVFWQAELGTKPCQYILAARKDKVETANSSLSQRATFLEKPPCLQISAVTQADSGNYSAEIERSDGCFCTKCFHVSVYEPVGSPHLEARVLQQDEERCSLQLSCTVPGASAVSYSWSRDREPLGNQSVLEVPKDVQPGLYVCNASNPASWSMASIDTATACTQTGVGAIPISAVTFLLLLAVFTAGFKTFRRRNRSNDDPGCSSPLGAGICRRRGGDGSAPEC